MLVGRPGLNESQLFVHPGSLVSVHSFQAATLIYRPEETRGAIFVKVEKHFTVELSTHVRKWPEWIPAPCSRHHHSPRVSLLPLPNMPSQAVR